MAAYWRELVPRRGPARHPFSPLRIKEVGRKFGTCIEEGVENLGVAVGFFPAVFFDFVHELHLEIYLSEERDK